MAKCESCGTTSSSNYARKTHCWKHGQCARCHYLVEYGGHQASVTYVNPKDDFRRI